MSTQGFTVAAEKSKFTGGHHVSLRSSVGGELVRAFQWVKPSDPIQEVRNKFPQYKDCFDACYIINASKLNPKGWVFTDMKETVKCNFNKNSGLLEERAVGNLVDQRYIENVVIPAYIICIAERQPICQRICSSIEGRVVLYERLAIPLYCKGGVNWLAIFTKIFLAFDNVSPDSVPLTKRESECLSLIASGAGAKKIASDLGISEKTVELHLSNSRKKLDAKNTVHAVTGIVARFFLD